jgi:hypothetical protein
MRTKALLIAAGALAATVISSEAQVYSQNIVGYVNIPQSGNISAFALPLDASGGNAATNIFPNVYNASQGQGPLDGNQLYIWNGSSFTVYTFDSLKATGFGNISDTGSPVATGVALPTPTLNPGQFVFIDNIYNATTNTVVGTVHVDFAATGSQTVGTTTNIVGGNLQFVASKLPIAGGISSVLGITNTYNASQGQGPYDGNEVFVPNIGAGGFTGYTEYIFDSLQPTGFGNKTDSGSPQTGAQYAAPEPVIQVGGGFIIDNIYNSFVWTQSL